MSHEQDLSIQTQIIKRITTLGVNLDRFGMDDDLTLDQSIGELLQYCDINQISQESLLQIQPLELLVALSSFSVVDDSTAFPNKVLNMIFGEKNVYDPTTFASIESAKLGKLAKSLFPKSRYPVNPSQVRANFFATAQFYLERFDKPGLLGLCKYSEDSLQIGVSPDSEFTRDDLLHEMNHGLNVMYGYDFNFAGKFGRGWKEAIRYLHQVQALNWLKLQSPELVKDCFSAYFGKLDDHLIPYYDVQSNIWQEFFNQMGPAFFALFAAMQTTNKPYAELKNHIQLTENNWFANTFEVSLNNLKNQIYTNKSKLINLIEREDQESKPSKNKPKMWWQNYEKFVELENELEKLRKIYFWQTQTQESRDLATFVFGEINRQIVLTDENGSFDLQICKDLVEECRQKVNSRTNFDNPMPNIRPKDQIRYRLRYLVLRIRDGFSR
jgi:hypothetical protein